MFKTNLICFLQILTALISFAISSSQIGLESFLNLNKMNLDHYLNNNKYMLAIFVDSLESSKDLQRKIEMMKFTKEKSDKKVNLVLAYVDIKEDLKIAKRFNVFKSGTIVYLANQRGVIFSPKDKSGLPVGIEEAKKELKVWLLTRIIKPSEPFTELEKIEEFRKTHDKTVTYAGLKNKYYAIFRYVASSYPDIHFAHSFSPPVNFFLTQVVERHNRTVMFSKMVEKTNFVIEAPWTQESLTEFINTHYNVLRSFDSKSLRRMMLRESKTLVLIHLDPGHQSVVNFFRVAMKLKKELYSVSIPLDSKRSSRKLVRFLGVGPRFNIDFPVIRLIERVGDELYKYKFEGSPEEMTEENILKFYNDHKSGFLRNYFKTEEPTEDELGSVKTLVGSEFQKKISDKLTDSVVFFHSAYCTECNDILLIFNKLAEKYGWVSDLGFYKLDALYNEGPGIIDGIIGDPVLKIYKADSGNDDEVEFEGVWQMSDIEEWLTSNLKIAGRADL